MIRLKTVLRALLAIFFALLMVFNGSDQAVARPAFMDSVISPHLATQGYVEGRNFDHVLKWTHSKAECLSFRKLFHNSHPNYSRLRCEYQASHGLWALVQA